MYISKEYIIKHNFDRWSVFAFQLNENLHKTIFILISISSTILLFVIIKNLKLNQNSHMFSDCNISDLLIQLIKDYYFDNNHTINGFNANELLDKNKISNKKLEECISYISSRTWKFRENHNSNLKFFDDTPNTSLFNINYNSYRTILFVTQQYNSSIIFQTNSKSIFFKDNSCILKHLNRLLTIYKSILSYNNRIINIIESDFNFKDFKLFIILSIFLCALHLKL